MYDKRGLNKFKIKKNYKFYKRLGLFLIIISLLIYIILKMLGL